jgi:hypothetical protein
MALVKIEDFAPNYRDHFDGKDIKGMDVYIDPEGRTVENRTGRLPSDRV